MAIENTEYFGAALPRTNASFILTFFKLNFNPKKGKMGKEKKGIGESNKSVENTHTNLSPYILLQNIKYQLNFIFFKLSTCDEVQKSI